MAPITPIHNETDEYVMFYNENDSLLFFQWKNKLLAAELFKTCVSFYAGLSEKYRPQKLLVDARDCKFVMTPVVQEWHDQVIVPRYRKAGVKAMAFIIPNNIFSELSHKKTFEKENAASVLPTQFFKSEAEAREWLDRRMS